VVLVMSEREWSRGLRRMEDFDQSLRSFVNAFLWAMMNPAGARWLELGPRGTLRGIRRELAGVFPRGSGTDRARGRAGPTYVAPGYATPRKGVTPHDQGHCW